MLYVFFQTLEEHVEHLRKVMTRLRENELYVKKEKFEFCQPRDNNVSWACDHTGTGSYGRTEGEGYHGLAYTAEGT